MIYDFLEMLEAQSELDNSILASHNLTRAETRNKRLLALLVELGEFANETRAFKFWSQKPMATKLVVLDEYVDAIHFFLSLKLDFNYKKEFYDIEINHDLSLSDEILQVFEDVAVFSTKPTEMSFETAFTHFLSLGLSLNFDFALLKEGYQKKMAINYKRQTENY